MKFTVSPACTTGPFFPRAFSDGSEDLVHRDSHTAQGQHILLAGRVLELGGKPTWNMVLEVWQPDANGVFRHPLDPRSAQADPGFWGWGRARTEKDGWYRFHTVFPGSYEDRCPHVNCAVLGIGLTRRLVTTIFFADNPDAARDPVLSAVSAVSEAALRRRLFAHRDPTLDESGALGYRFDVILRGEGETPFFVD